MKIQHRPLQRVDTAHRTVIRWIDHLNIFQRIEIAKYIMKQYCTYDTMTLFPEYRHSPP